MLSRFASRIYTAFPSVFNKTRAVTEIGNPVRSEIEDIKSPALRMARDGPLRVLVVGGSRGASSLNTHVPAALAECNQPISVWHQTGEADLDQTRRAYAKLGLDAKVSPFIDEIVDAYCWADLIICRAGAMTVSEIAAVGLASVLIPYPFAVDDHQTFNAQWLVDADAAKLLSNDDLNTESLATALKPLLSNKDRLVQMSINARTLHKPAAAQTVADALLEAAADEC